MKAQGRCIVERQSDGEIMVMYPIGTVVVVSDNAQADKICRAWFRGHVKGNEMGVGKIEWRGVKPQLSATTGHYA